MNKLPLLFLLALPAFGQLFSPIIDAPQHLIAVGAGVGASTKDWAVVGGYGELLNAASGTYSYTGVSIVPALVAAPSGGRTLRLVPTVTTGVKQILYQQGRFTVAVDAGAGASLPNAQTSAFNFAAVGGVDLAWHLKGKNYIGAEVKWSGLSGSVSGTVSSAGLAFIHSM